MVSFVIITTLVVLANSWHVLAAWFMQPEGTYFTGIAHYFADYFLYTSLMAQKGWIVTHHLFTNESLAPTWIYWLYTMLGKFGNPFLIYNVSVVVFSILLLFLWWKMIKLIFPKQLVLQYIAFLFVATGSGFAGSEFWFSPLPALNRLGGVPHQIFQTILLLSVILLFTYESATGKKLSLVDKAKLWSGKPYGYIAILMAGVSFLAATANPIQMLLLSIAITITSPRSIIYLLPAVFGAIITNIEFARDPILAAAKVWENSQNVSVNLWQYILALGPIAVLIPFGIKQYTKDITPIRKILLFYSGLSLVMFFSPLPKLMGTSPVRWLSPAAYTIFPILATFGLTRLSSQLLSDRRKVDYFVKVILLMIYVVITIPSLFHQIQSRMSAPRDLLYVPKEVIQSLRNLPGTGVVLTDPITPYDVVVPVFTGRKTFTGHPIHTLYPDVKEALRNKYFSGGMTSEDQQKFITDHNIATIYEP